MSPLDGLFPELPSYKGYWQTIYLEPIVGSGEKIAIASIATGDDSQFKIIQSIRTELLEYLYGSQSVNISGMINWIIDSAYKELKSNRDLSNWQVPFDGIICGKRIRAFDDNIDGILRQSIRLTSSLSTLALDADREPDDYQSRKYTEQWARSISDELKNINPSLNEFFNKKMRTSEANVLTTYGFYTDVYTSNFGLLVPTRISSSLNSLKAKLFDLESLKKSPIVLIPKKLEIIIGAPSFSDPTLSEKSIHRMQNTLNLINEVAEKENIQVFRAESARSAAERINLMAA